jgi:hypothetical protein
MKRISVVFSKISFIGTDILDSIFGMTSSGDTKREIQAVTEGE